MLFRSYFVAYYPTMNVICGLVLGRLPNHLLPCKWYYEKYWEGVSLRFEQNLIVCSEISSIKKKKFYCDIWKTRWKQVGFLTILELSGCNVKKFIFLNKSVPKWKKKIYLFFRLLTCLNSFMTNTKKLRVECYDKT